MKQATIDNALKLALMNAKATDIDYLSYKIKNGNNNLQLDEKGNIEGVNGLTEDFKKVYPQHLPSYIIKLQDVICFLVIPITIEKLKTNKI